MSHAFYADAWKRTARRDCTWYQEHLMPALLAAKEKQARDIDATIAIAQELLRILVTNIKPAKLFGVHETYRPTPPLSQTSPKPRLGLTGDALRQKFFPKLAKQPGYAVATNRAYEEPVEKPTPVPSHDIECRDDDSLMKPIEPDIMDLFYGSTEKGAAEQYLRARNKKAPEDKFYFRLLTSWDYGWQQKQSRLRARDVNRGRCAILRDTFYRKNNLGPDPRHYSAPAGGEISICSEYACNTN